LIWTASDSLTLKEVAELDRKYRWFDGFTSYYQLEIATTA